MSVEQRDLPQRPPFVAPTPSDEGSEPGFDTVGFLLRRKWLIAFGMIVGLSLGYVYFVRQPAEYQSSGRVMVNKPMSHLPISGGVAMDMSIRQRDPLANDILTISSKEIVGPAVEDNKLNELPTFKQAANPVSKIISGMTVRRVDDGADLLEVRYKGPYPEDCELIVNAVLRSYQKHVERQFINSSNRIVNLLSDVRVDLQNQLDQAEAEYRTFRKETALLADGDTVKNPHLDSVRKTNEKIAELEIESRTINGKIDAIHEALKSGGSREAIRMMIDQTARPGEVETTQVSALEAMKRELFPLLLEEEMLLQSHGVQHPKVLEIRKRIELTRQFLTEAGINQEGVKQKPIDFVEVYVNSLRLQLSQNATEQETLRELGQQQLAEAKALSDLEVQHGDLLAKKTRLRELFSGVKEKLEDVNYSADGGGYSAEIILPAGRGYQVAPNFAKIMTMGGILGALCGLLLGYVVESADQTFKSPEEISHLLGLQIVGHCPLITATGRPRDFNGDASVDPSVVTFYKPKSRGAEAFRAIRTALYFSTRGAKHKVIQVTSPHPGDGKSTLSSNLAVTIAQSGKKVVIVDADFRRPRVHKIFGVHNETGMSSAIAGEIDISDAIQQTPVANLDCLACGPRPDNPSELLTSAKFDELLAVLREKYDFVLVDTPPVLAVTDPSAVAARVDGVLLCIRVNNKSRLDAVRATEMLSQLEANILGIVVNGIDGSSKSNYGYGSRGSYRAGHMYGYGYGYGYGMSDETAHPSHAKYFAEDRDTARTNGRRQKARS